MDEAYDRIMDSLAAAGFSILGAGAVMGRQPDDAFAVERVPEGFLVRPLLGTDSVYACSMEAFESAFEDASRGLVGQREAAVLRDAMLRVWPVDASRAEIEIGDTEMSLLRGTVGPLLSAAGFGWEILASDRAVLATDDE